MQAYRDREGDNVGFVANKESMRLAEPQQRGQHVSVVVLPFQTSRLDDVITFVDHLTAAMSCQPAGLWRTYQSVMEGGEISGEAPGKLVEMVEALMRK